MEDPRYLCYLHLSRPRLLLLRSWAEKDSPPFDAPVFVIANAHCISFDGHRKIFVLNRSIRCAYNKKAVKPSNPAPRAENAKARLSVRLAPLLPLPEVVAAPVLVPVDEPLV